MAEYLACTFPPASAISGNFNNIIRNKDLPPRGGGYLSGSYPGGITRIEGVPGSALIRVIYRPEPESASDGVLVAQVASAPDGTWVVEGLDPSLRCDVVCRLEGYNDMILSNVSPSIA